MGASSNKKKKAPPMVEHYQTAPEPIKISDVDSKGSSNSKDKNNNNIIINEINEINETNEINEINDNPNMNANNKIITNNITTIHVNDIEDDNYSTKSHTKTKNSNCLTPKISSRNLTQPENIKSSKNEEVNNNNIKEDEEVVEKSTKSKQNKHKKKSCDNNRRTREEVDKLYTGNEHKVYFLNYNEERFPNHPRTLYFKNDYRKIPKNLLAFGVRPTDKNYVDVATIKNNHYFLGIRTFFSGCECFLKTLKCNSFYYLDDYKHQNITYVDPCKFHFDIINDLTKFQKYNHFPFSNELGTKNNLYKNYFLMKQKFPKDFKYMAESYILPDDKETFLKKIGNKYEIKPNNMWIIKPFNLFGGSGVELMTSIKDLPEQAVVVKYIYNPFLINLKKFDLRLYTLVTGYAPLKIYLYNEGLVRFASENYNIDKRNLKNSFIHLTNVAVNKKYKGDGSVMKWSLTYLINYLKKEQIDFSEIWKKIKDLVIKTFVSITDLAVDQLKNDYSFVNHQNLFELYGFDVILDSRLEPYLLEMNANPMLGSTKNVDAETKTNLITDILNVVGIYPFDHTRPDVPFDKQIKYKSKVDEAVKESFVEFSRPMGGWSRIFPLKNNINYYKQFIENPGKENLKLWRKLKKQT